MAQERGIVKRLASIENFGSMNVICSDKTGTLTEGIVHLQAALDVEGAPSDNVLLHAYLNAFYETGFTNPIDQAIRTQRQFDLTGYVDWTQLAPLSRRMSTYSGGLGVLAGGRHLPHCLLATFLAGARTVSAYATPCAFRRRKSGTRIAKPNAG